jgi:CDP-glucose 4,6-dehydratase
LELLDRTTLVPQVLNEASHEIPKQYLDCSKAKRMMQWQPKYSLEAGLVETIAWYREYLSIPVSSPARV